MSRKYERMFCAFPCKNYTVHYKLDEGDWNCIHHHPNGHDLAEFMLQKTGYRWLKHLRDSKRLMDYGIENN